MGQCVHVCLCVCVHCVCVCVCVHTCECVGTIHKYQPGMNGSKSNVRLCSVAIAFVSLSKKLYSHADCSSLLNCLNGDLHGVN